jgi:hypothetical protein
LNIRWAGAALVAASVGLITGCVGVDAAVTPPPVNATAAPAATQIPTSQPETLPEDVDDPATWIVDGSGIGPVRRVAVFEPGSAEVGPYTVAPGECPNPAVTFLEGVGLAGLTVVTEAGGQGVDVVEVTNWDPSEAVVSPATAAGVRLGATETELQAAYPGLAQAGSSNNSDVFAVEDTDGWIVFWTMDDVVVLMSASPAPTVPSELCG